MDKKEFRVSIKHCFLMGKNTVNEKRLDKRYRDSDPGRSTINKRRLLTTDQKQQHLEDSERCLELFKRNKKDFLRRYVTMGEIWIHYYTPETKLS